MSTILKALKKLEHDKQVDAAQSRAHDPLAPAPEPMVAPRPEPEGEWRGLWGLIAGVAALFCVGVGFGVYTLSRDEGGSASTPAVAAAPGAGGGMVLAAPARPDFHRMPPVAGVEPVGAGSGATSPRSSQPTRLAAASSAPDPWEEAATATTTNSASPDAAARPPDRPATPVVAAPPPTRAPSSPTPAASTAPPAASRTAPSPVAPSTQASRDVPEPSGVPIAALPVIDLPEEEPPAAVSAPPEPAASVPAEPAPESSAAAVAEVPARPGLGNVVVSDAAERVDVKVLKTVWHPKPDRRSARLELSNRESPVEVHESDLVEGYVVEEITPSKVLLSKDGVTLTRRVGD